MEDTDVGVFVKFMGTLRVFDAVNRELDNNFYSTVLAGRPLDRLPLIDEEETIKTRMAAELDSSGRPLFNLASGISLMLFYAFAMQCMSTLAIVKRETNSWKWPLFQLGFMSVFAYLVALIAYQILI